MSRQQTPITKIAGGAYPTCDVAQTSGQDASPVYLVTSLAVTPQGSRRIGQYEVSGMSITPPPAALGLDGPAAIFSPRPSSNVWFANGNDTGVAGYTASGGTGTCAPSSIPQVPGVGTGDATGVTT